MEITTTVYEKGKSNEKWCLKPTTTLKTGHITKATEKV